MRSHFVSKVVVLGVIGVVAFITVVTVVNMLITGGTQDAAVAIDDHGCLTDKGFSWCELKQSCLSKTEKCIIMEDVFQVLESARTAAELPEDTPMKAEFVWQESEHTQPMAMRGLMMSFEDVAEEKRAALQSALEADGFVESLPNSATGQHIQFWGFARETDGKICLLQVSPFGYDPTDQSQVPVEQKTMSLSCANTQLDASVENPDDVATPSAQEVEQE